MDEAKPEIEIDASPDAAWAKVGDFGGIEWMPGIDKVTVDGNQRVVSTMGVEITEELRSRSDEDRQITYAIVAGPAPCESHEATVTVDPSGDGCRVTWAVRTEPDDSVSFFGDMYLRSLEALKTDLEG